MSAMNWEHADLMRVSGQSSSVVSQWRGVGRGKVIQSIGKLEAAEAIERATGYSALLVAKGMGPKRVQGWMPDHHPKVGPGLGAPGSGVAHPLSEAKFEDAPTVIAWERILKEPLKAEFQTLMPDASMEPDVPRGARVIFVTGEEPVPGDWVLCKDSDSNLYLREMRQIRPGRWEAHAINPAFLPMDSERDGLSVVAVYDGVRGRKGRV